MAVGVPISSGGGWSWYLVVPLCVGEFVGVCWFGSFARVFGCVLAMLLFLCVVCLGSFVLCFSVSGWCCRPV